MPRVAPGQRKRAYRPKTRSGCITCKIRRVKCDEAQPFCGKCISTGRKCDGYDGSNTETPSGLSRASSEALSRSPSVGFLGSEKERRSFHFFQQRTAPQLSGFFGGDFWERLLLQATHHEPSIRHAIIALGSLHERFEQDNGLIVQSRTNGWTDDFALNNYNQAINFLVKPLSHKGQQAIDVCLISSILFACFETMQSSYGSAITHVQSGMKILCEVQYNEKTRRHHHNVLGASEIPYVPMEMLEEMFMRLDLQVTQMVGGQKWEIYELMKKYARKREIPAAFSTLSQARDSLVFHWHVVSYAMCDIWDPTSEKHPEVLGAWRKKSISILERWSSAFDAYLLSQGDNLTDNEKKGASVLCILKELGSTSMMLTRSMVDDQRNWDVFCPIFQKIVALAQDIVELDLKSTAGKPTFCIDMALVGPLFEVSCRCRDPIIRRRAISILRNCGRTEGVWNAFLTSKVAQRVVEIEEAGLVDVKSCEDVPDWARISNVSPLFDPVGRKATLTYSRPESAHDNIRQTVEEVIEW